MITCNLMGGMGNQLFQWAASQAAAKAHKTECYYLAPYFLGESDWKFSLYEFGLKPKILEQHLFVFPEIQDDFHYRPFPNDSYLNGYWQSEKYFEKNKDTLRKELEINDERKYHIMNTYPFLKDETVSLHVRRGDYLKASHVHPSQTLDYYNRAVDLTTKSDTNILVFSDDIKWCKENFKYDNMYFSENQTNTIDLYSMSLCSHNIIANSSFSWWGAWLNNNVDKKVVAPKNWFANGTYSGDIVPESWTTI